MLFLALILACISPGGGQSVSPSPGLPVVWSSTRTLSAGVYTFTSSLVITAPVTITGVVRINAPAVTISPWGSITGVGGGSAGGQGGGAVVGACWITPGASYSGEGGSHGGCQSLNYVQQTCPGVHATTFDSAFLPNATGCGGGGSQYSTSCPAGGAGGAALIINTTGTLVVNGTISVNGAAGAVGVSACYEGGGGGSGGSVLLRARVLGYSVGSVTAQGGPGGTSYNSYPQGGGGGGGRIAVLCDAHSYPSASWSDWKLMLSAAGGVGSAWTGPSNTKGVLTTGAPGTVLVDCGSRVASLLVQGDPGTSVGSITANSSLPLLGNTVLAELNITNAGRLLVTRALGAPAAVTLTVLTALGDGTGAPSPGAGVTICGWPGAGGAACSASASPASSPSASPSAVASVSAGASSSPSISSTASSSASASAAATPVTTTISANTSFFGVNDFPGPLVIAAGAWVTVTGLVIVRASTIIVMANGGFTGVGRGWPALSGPCWQTPFNRSDYAYSGEGGAHGGCSATSSLGTGCPTSHIFNYGDALAPNTLGCGGAPGMFSITACQPAGAGGAALHLFASSLLVVNGSIIMDGSAAAPALLDSCYEAGGGGAGGSILLSAPQLGLSTGTLSVRGGAGGMSSHNYLYGPGGGGGRIAVLCGAHAYASADWSDWKLGMSAAGGYGGTWVTGQWRVGSISGAGGSGTIWVDCGTRAASLRIISPEGTGVNVTSSLILSSNLTVAELTLLGGGNLLVSSTGPPVKLLIASAVRDGMSAPVALDSGVTICGWPGGPICSQSVSPSVSASPSVSPSVSPTRGLSPSLSPSTPATSSASASRSPSPTQSPFPCNAQTAVMQTVGGTYTFAQAQSTCRNLGPGWDLPSIIDWSTYALVTGSANVAWTGLYDTQRWPRPVSLTNQSYAFWRWSSGCDASFFIANQRNVSIDGGFYPMWNTGEPNNSPNEYCAQTIASGLLNDKACSSTFSPAVCMYMERTVPSVTPSVSPSASRSRSNAASTSTSPSRSTSASASASASRSVTATASRSRSTDASRTGTSTATAVPTTSVSPGASASVTATMTVSTSWSGTATATVTGTGTLSGTCTGTSAATVTSSISASGTPTAAATASLSPGALPSASSTTTPLPPSSSRIPSSSPTATLSTGASPSGTPPPTASSSATGSETPSSGSTNSLSPGASASATATLSLGAAGSAASSPSSSATGSSAATASSSASAGAASTLPSASAAPAATSSPASGTSSLPSSAVTAPASSSSSASVSPAAALAATPQIGDASAAAGGGVAAAAGGAAGGLLILAAVAFFLITRRGRPRARAAALTGSPENGVPGIGDASAKIVESPLSPAAPVVAAAVLSRTRGASEGRLAYAPAAPASSSQPPRHVAIARASSFRAPSIDVAPAPAAGPSDGARAAAEVGLAPGWEAVWSRSKQVFYYKHGESGEVAWDKPALAVEASAGAAEVVSAAGVLAYQASKAGQVNAEVGLPPGWTAVWSTSRAVWYWRSDAGETSWVKPTRTGSLARKNSERSARILNAAPAPTNASADAAAATESEAAGRADAEAGLPDGWSAHWSRSRSLWYWKGANGEVAWEKPATVGGGAPDASSVPPLPPGWTEHTSRSTGKTYWKSDSGETSWTLPVS